VVVAAGTPTRSSFVSRYVIDTPEKAGEFAGGTAIASLLPERIETERLRFEPRDGPARYEFAGRDDETDRYLLRADDSLVGPTVRAGGRSGAPGRGRSSSN